MKKDFPLILISSFSTDTAALTDGVNLHVVDRRGADGFRRDDISSATTSAAAIHPNADQFAHDDDVYDESLYTARLLTPSFTDCCITSVNYKLQMSI